MKQLMEQVLQGLNGKKADIPETSFKQAYINEEQHITVFLSVSIQNARAHVFQGKGKSLKAAVEAAVEQAGNCNADAVKLDVVTEIAPAKKDTSWMNISKEAITYKRRADGFMIGKEISPLMFLPEEVEAYGMIRGGKLQKEHIFRAFEKHGLLEDAMFTKEMISEEWMDVYKFRTAGFYLGSEGYHALFRGHREYEELASDDLREAVKLTRDHYFTQVVNSQGKYVYSFEPQDNHVAKGYNILRHAGTTYSMLETYEMMPEERLLRTVEKAIRYLLKRVRQLPVENGKDVEVVVEADNIKLGGNGLSIIALAKYTQVTGDRQYVPLMRNMARWMKSIQDETGKFAVHKQVYSTGEQTEFISHYYSGEAILGLVRLYQVDPDEMWLDMAGQEADYLINRRDKKETKKTIAHDHWLLYALNELHQERPEEQYEKHAYFIAEAIMETQRLNPEDVDREWIGSYEMKGIPRSTPNACRSEGIGAVYQLALRKKDESMAERCRKAVLAALKFQLQMQFKKESVLYLDHKTFCLGAVHQSLIDYEVRNDYTQHNISSFIAGFHILSEER